MMKSINKQEFLKNKLVPKPKKSNMESKQEKWSKWGIKWTLQKIRPLREEVYCKKI